jgi:predicted TIM-barrel fold metal-dependent hydrolase
MVTEVTDRADKVRPPSVQIIDCDIHPQLPQGLQSLFPYLPDAWQDRFATRASSNYSTGFEGGFAHPLASFFLKRDAAPPSGLAPGADPDFARVDLLDRLNIARALMVPLTSINGWVDPDEATVIAAAHNRYLSEHWLTKDERFRLAMVVAALDPIQAAAEIRDFGRHPQVAAVFMPVINVLMGQRHYYPIYEAAQELQLPIVYHATAAESIHPNAPFLAGGVPTSYAERFTTIPQVAESSVPSLVWEGVFERFPSLHFVFAEVGFAWVPHYIWRLDSGWKSFRHERPWVKRPPSEYIYERVRFTTQPYPEPPKPDQLTQMLDMVHADRTLLFSSDYPHWDGDDPAQVLRKIQACGDDNLVRAIFSESAKKTFPRLGL